MIFDSFTDMIDEFHDMSHLFVINHEYPYGMSATGPSHIICRCEDSFMANYA